VSEREREDKLMVPWFVTVRSSKPQCPLLCTWDRWKAFE
jgi:hypothetical protein